MEAENVASIIPLDELTERLELIQKIEDKIRRWARRRGSDSASFALLLCAPIQFLRYHGHSLNVASSLSSSTSGLVKYSRHIWQLLRLFLEEDAQGPSATLSAERKAWDRESCVVTGDPLPVVCHIVPLTTCSDYTRVERFASSLWAVHTGLIPHEDIDYSALCHCLDGPGVSNHVWNMISVDPRIRDFRRHAGIGFKCLGIFPSERGPEESLVRVQPVLMVKGAVPWKRKKRNEAWLRQYVSPKETWLRRYVHVRVATVDARKMKMAFDIQWALVRLAALTGAARARIVGLPPDGVDHEPDEGPAESTCRLCRWLQQTHTFEPPLLQPPLEDMAPPSEREHESSAAGD